MQRAEDNQFMRTELLIGASGVKRLKESVVAVFGLGGVGGFVCEGLVRAGVGKLILIDNDIIDITNLKRQIIALHSTVGLAKVDVMEERLKDINPDLEIEKHNCFYLPASAGQIELSKCNYIVDAVDTVAAKIELAMQADKLGIPIIASMGTGNKLDPTKLEIADITQTSVCPLAKVMRKAFRERGIKRLKVVYSKEEPVKNKCAGLQGGQRSAPGSVSFVPSVAGLIIAGEVIRELVNGY